MVGIGLFTLQSPGGATRTQSLEGAKNTQSRKGAFDRRRCVEFSVGIKPSDTELVLSLRVDCRVTGEQWSEITLPPRK